MRFYLIILIGVLISSFSSAEDVSVVLKVKFKTADSSVQPSQKYIIDNLYEVIEKFPSARVYVTGHTDNIGSEVSNQGLSERRSASIHNIILEKGIDSKKMSTVGMGETAPLASNDTEDGRQLNRRVVVVFTALSDLKVTNLKTVIALTEGVKILKNESPVVQAYIRGQESKIIPTKKIDSPKPEKLKVDKKPNGSKLSLELNSFHSELESEDGSPGANFNEVLTEVRTSVRIQYEKPIKGALSLGFELGAKWYEFSTDLNANVAEDQTKVGFNLGVGLKHKTFSWLRNELWLGWNQQLYFEDVLPGAPVQWSFELADVLRLDWRLLLIPINSNSFDLEIGPIFSVFTGSSDDTKSGYSLGAQAISHFLFSKKLGFGVSYQRAYFDFEDPNSLELNNEILEIGFHYDINF